jgi:hypothetical protein
LQLQLQHLWLSADLCTHFQQQAVLRVHHRRLLSRHAKRGSIPAHAITSAVRLVVLLWSGYTPAS